MLWLVECMCSDKRSDWSSCAHRKPLCLCREVIGAPVLTESPCAYVKRVIGAPELEDQSPCACENGTLAHAKVEHTDAVNMWMPPMYEMPSTR